MSTQWAKSPKKQSVGCILTTWHSILSAKLTKTHSSVFLAIFFLTRS